MYIIIRRTFSSLFLFLSPYFFSLSAQIVVNKVDSLGYKQGVWVEYKVYSGQGPYQSVIIKDPIDTTKLYITTELIFDESAYVHKCLGSYKNGLKEGVWFEFYKDGAILRQVEFKNGVPFGNYVNYWPNGNVRIKSVVGKSGKIEVYAYNEDGEFILKRERDKKEFIEVLYENY